jgi:hypothetical protein
MRMCVDHADVLSSHNSQCHLRRAYVCDVLNGLRMGVDECVSPATSASVGGGLSPDTGVGVDGGLSPDTGVGVDKFCVSRYK